MYILLMLIFALGAYLSFEATFYYGITILTLTVVLYIIFNYFFPKIIQIGRKIKIGTPAFSYRSRLFVYQVKLGGKKVLMYSKREYLGSAEISPWSLFLKGWVLTKKVRTPFEILKYYFLLYRRWKKNILIDY